MDDSEFQLETVDEASLSTHREEILWEALTDPGSYNPLSNGFFWVGLIWGVPFPLLFLWFQNHTAPAEVYGLIVREPIHVFFLVQPLLFAIFFGLFGSIGHHYIDRLREETNHDYLTGLYNHRFFREELDKRISEAERYDLRFCLILLDLDHFKRVNDQYGHQVGDQVLKEFSGILESMSRESDLVFRYGGEEFTIIVPETELREGEDMAERIRERIANHDFGIEEQLTVSAGVAEYPTDSVNRIDLIQVVDDRLYEAKAAGRNQVVAENTS